MGFKDAKAALISALKTGNYQHQSRANINTKNLLFTGVVTAAQVLSIIGRCNGSHHTTSKHHSINAIDIHVIEIEGWYVKFYVINPNVMFISVHQ